jgi:hypothetical protein
MEAGVDPERFWELTPAEIAAQIGGYRRRAQFEAMQTYMLVSAWMKDPVSPQRLFPGLFDGMGKPSPAQDWKTVKARVMAHADDYKRNGGTKT